MLQPIKTNCKLQPVVLIDQQGKRSNGYYIYEHIDLDLFSNQPSRWTVFDKNEKSTISMGALNSKKSKKLKEI
jgi:hypothetical protein